MTVTDVDPRLAEHRWANTTGNNREWLIKCGSCLQTLSEATIRTGCIGHVVVPRLVGP